MRVSRTCQKRPDIWLNQAADLAAKRHPRGDAHFGPWTAPFGALRLA